MSDDLDELDAALRRAMAALDGDAPAGYFAALPGRTLARLDDPAIGELPEEPARPLRAVQGLRPPADADADADVDAGDDDDDAVFASQIMAAVELFDEAERSGPARTALPRRDRASASSSSMRAIEDAADGGGRGELRIAPASASSVGMRAVAVDVGGGEPGDPRETVAGSDLGTRSASSRITMHPVPSVEPARPQPAAGARSAGAAASRTEVARDRRGRRVRAAIVGIGGVALAAVAVMYLRAGDRAPRSAASSVSSRGPASPSAGSGTSGSSPAAVSAANPGAGETTVASAGPAAAGGPASGSAATPATAAGSGGMPGPASGPAAGTGTLGELVKGHKPEMAGKTVKSAKLPPDRTSLSGDDIERAMTAVAVQARACFAEIQGKVSLRLTVAPSGKVVLVAVIGAFAGTPAGACVKRVVLGATFPAWSGAPQSFDYSYLLSD